MELPPILGTSTSLELTGTYSCHCYHLQPFPISPLTLRYFTAHPAHLVKHTNIKNVSFHYGGIRRRPEGHGKMFTVSDYNILNPASSTQMKIHYPKTKVIKRSQGEVRHPRLPITTSILWKLKIQLHHCSDLVEHFAWPSTDSSSLVSLPPQPHIALTPAQHYYTATLPCSPQPFYQKTDPYICAT